VIDVWGFGGKTPAVYKRDSRGKPFLKLQNETGWDAMGIGRSGNEPLVWLESQATKWGEYIMYEHMICHDFLIHPDLSIF